MVASAVLIPGLAGLFSGSIFLVVAYCRFAKAPDGTLSWANVQLITWTGVILGGYVAIAVHKGGFPDSVPDNLLLLMGVSVGTQAGSRLVRAGQNQDAAEKKPEPVRAAGFRGLVASEKIPTEVSVAKLQHLAWTVVGVLVYIVAIISALGSGASSLPDVGNGLPALMLISASGYIANKIGDKPAQ